MICENQKISVDDIAAKLDVTRRTILRDVQEIKKKVFLVYDKKEGEIDREEEEEEREEEKERREVEGCENGRR